MYLKLSTALFSAYVAGEDFEIGSKVFTQLQWVGVEYVYLIKESVDYNFSFNGNRIYISGHQVTADATQFEGRRRTNPDYFYVADPSRGDLRRLKIDSTGVVATRAFLAGFSKTMTQWDNMENELAEIASRVPVGRCGSCGCDIFEESEMHTNPTRSGGVLCSECHRRMVERGIKQYSYKPEPEFYGEGEFHVGIEVELEDVGCSEDIDRVAYLVTKEMDGFCYCKSDSSINDGFETVTHPFTLEYERENGLVEKMLTKLKEYGMDGGRDAHINSCGVHVHMSLNGLTDPQIFRIMTFCGINSEFVKEISHRTNMSHMSSYASMSFLEDPDRVYSVASCRGGLGHSTAFNFSDHTIEFRIFNSTTNYDELMSFIEFTYALRFFSQEVEDLDNYDVATFTQFAKEKEYNCLIKSIKETREGATLCA